MLRKSRKLDHKNNSQGAVLRVGGANLSPLGLTLLLTKQALRHQLEKQAKKPDVPKCAYKASGEPDLYPACGQPAEYCETQPLSAGTYELRLYWICRQHAELEDAEKEWGDSISDLLEWEWVLHQAHQAKTREEIVDLLEKGCEERRRLCDEFAAYVDSMRYTGKGEHPLG